MDSLFLDKKECSMCSLYYTPDHQSICLPEGFSTSRNNEEFLKSKLVSSVLSSVDNIEAGDWENIGGGVTGNVSIVLPEWNTLSSSSSFTGSKRDYVLIDEGWAELS
jgi:hypothetical protein